MAIPPPEIEIRRVEDFAALGKLWRDFERRADGSFFQSWAWTGCLAEMRFTDPWLLTARRNDEVVAAALFNRAARGALRLSRRLLLGESGNPERDSIFIEHNGLLVDRGADSGLARRCWRALGDYRQGGLRKAHWVLGGVPETMCSALPGNRKVKVTARRVAPYFDISLVPPERATIDYLSANTRQQLRRSLRAWAEIGPLQLDRAETPEASDDYLDALAILHQRYWRGRGKPGAFAAPFFARFHHTLIRRAAAERQSVDLLRISAGDKVVGYLYNFIQDGRVSAYQSGFDFGPEADRLRPGLICHLMAIEHYRRAGMRVYDFLGGEARYKRSFANAETELLWLDVRPKLPWQSSTAAVSTS